MTEREEKRRGRQLYYEDGTPADEPRNEQDGYVEIPRLLTAEQLEVLREKNKLKARLKKINAEREASGLPPVGTRIRVQQGDPNVAAISQLELHKLSQMPDVDGTSQEAELRKKTVDNSQFLATYAKANPTGTGSAIISWIFDSSVSRFLKVNRLQPNPQNLELYALMLSYERYRWTEAQARSSSGRMVEPIPAVHVATKSQIKPGGTGVADPSDVESEFTPTKLDDFKDSSILDYMLLKAADVEFVKMLISGAAVRFITLVGYYDTKDVSEEAMRSFYNKRNILIDQFDKIDLFCKSVRGHIKDATQTARDLAPLDQHVKYHTTKYSTPHGLQRMIKSIRGDLVRVFRWDATDIGTAMKCIKFPDVVENGMALSENVMCTYLAYMESYTGIPKGYYQAERMNSMADPRKRDLYRRAMDKYKKMSTSGSVAEAESLDDLAVLMARALGTEVDRSERIVAVFGRNQAATDEQNDIDELEFLQKHLPSNK
jgi:hypothetical protein